MNGLAILAALNTGLVIGLGFAVTSLAVTYSRESKPLRVFVVDASYHLLGCVTCALIIAAWR